ncbi:uncharacterized protein LOC128677822 isoform X2 [Plodia interpunctella]|uniref:uncharacterized protein LOC128677822 isoform X2 n=1 Tax=Plodia interpunctella TaxID=58824 RepID=UPI0023685DB1|nr:uncharacterized protein LOC128677822 isoform X2 [Plodia interpunctella]
MSLPSKVNKENFRLLDLSSDEESEDLHLEIIPNRKKKITRRDRNRGGPIKAQEPNIGTEVRCALRWAVRGTLILWLLMLTWICAALYDQVSVMRIEIDKVSTSSEGVGDALQVCHTSSKVLKENVTDLSQRLIKLEQDHMELVKQVDLSKAELAAITDKLAAAPTLGQMPTRLAQLEKTVAHFGSQIQGFDSGINTARSQAATAAAGVDDIKALLDKLHAKNNETLASVSASRKDSEELRAQLAALNSTLAARVDALQSKVDELQKLSATAAPTPASTTTSSTTTTTTTTAPPPGPPAKPNVLQ